MAENTKKKRRAQNWSRDDESTLVNAVEPYYKELFGAHSAKLDERRKTTLWALVTDTVNATTTSKRSTQEIKKKWTKLKGNAKEKAATILVRKRKTGGGETDDEELDDIEERITGLDEPNKKIAKMIGKTGIVGVSGGFDSKAFLKKITPDDCELATTSHEMPEIIVCPTPSFSTSMLEDSKALISISKTSSVKKTMEKKLEIKELTLDVLKVQQNMCETLNSFLPVFSRIAEALEKLVKK